MKRLLVLACLLLFALGASAQSETCPRIWRNGDSLLTDPAPHVQWLRDGAAIPGANERWFVPTEAGSYAVQVSSTPSAAHSFGAGYTLAGYLFDELHRPVAGAKVRYGSFSATSDGKGRFVLWVNERKPAKETPVVVSVEKAGYWRNASRQYVSSFHETETRIMLHTQRVTNRVDATKGGEMAYRGFTLQLPPNAVQTESGAPYSGTILLSVEGATPNDPDFGLRMPGGDFAAIDEGGNDVLLYSYGYLTAEMTTESGEKLELRPDARATLRFQLPWKETHRPDSVPLWHFNTETAVWEQEGWSVRNGLIYEGQVSHFSSWNCDIPAERSACKGRVLYCNDEPIKGGWVRVGQRNVVADSLGNYWTFVPGGITFDAWAAVDTLRSITVPAEQERTLEDLTGSSFSGMAFYNPETRALNVYLSGNVPENLRLSIDGGQSWTGEREWMGIAAAPSIVRLDGGCTDRLRVVVLPRPEDCRKLAGLELEEEITYNNLEEALNAEQAYKLRLDSSNVSIEWELLLRLGCLHWLNLTENQLTNVPESIGSHANLQELNLDHNELTSLPESIGNLTNLHSLGLGWNQLTSVPESIGNLTNLQMLSLDRNELAVFPERAGNLTSLKVLGLGANRLTSVPESIGNLSSLQNLSLDSNELTSLPESIGNLVNLRVLQSVQNQLTDLPESIGNLANLRSLYLSSNQLTDLPASIANLADTLQRLYLEGNPIPVERRAAIQALLPNTTIYW